MSTRAYVRYVSARESETTDDDSTTELTTRRAAVRLNHGGDPSHILPQIAELRDDDTATRPYGYVASHVVAAVGGQKLGVTELQKRLCDPSAPAPQNCLWSYEIVVEGPYLTDWQLRVSLGTPPNNGEWDLDAPLGDALPLLRDVSGRDGFLGVCAQLDDGADADHAAPEGGQ